MPKVIKNVLLTVVVLVGAVLIIELLAFLFFKAGFAVRTAEQSAVTHPYHPYLGWENAPNTTITGTRCGGLHAWAIETDEHGRSITPFFDLEDADVNVVVLGGSTMFGVGSTGNAATVPSLIERELCERTGVKVEVYNLAVNGYMSFQEMLVLKRFMATNRVDIAVSISGKNDAHYAALEKGPEFGLLPERFHKPAEFIRSIECGEMKALGVGTNLLVRRLRCCSNAIDLFAKILELIPAGDAVRKPRMTAAPDEAEIERRARVVAANHAMTEFMAKQNGTRYFMFLQPTALTRSTLTEEEKRCMDLLDEPNIHFYFAAEKIFYAALRSCEKSYAFFDITGCLDDMSGPAYVDASHYRDEAARVVADAVCNVIAPVAAEIARERRVN